MGREAGAPLGPNSHYSHLLCCDGVLSVQATSSLCSRDSGDLLADTRHADYIWRDNNATADSNHYSSIYVQGQLWDGSKRAFPENGLY